MVFEVVSSSLPSCKVANTSGREVDGREGGRKGEREVRRSERWMGGREGRKGGGREGMEGKEREMEGVGRKGEKSVRN